MSYPTNGAQQSPPAASPAPMIVMMICHYDDTNFSGGLERQTRLLSEALRAAGENIVVLGSTRKLSRARWSLDEGVPVRLFWTFASPQISGRYLPAALLWALQLFIWVVLHRARISLIHGHQIRIHAFVSAFARRLFGIPAILKSATGGPGSDIKAIGSRKYFGPRGRNFVVANTNCFIATARAVEQDLLDFGVAAEQIRLIPNGRIMPSIGAERLPPAARSRRCLFLGRLSADKNPIPLAEAALSVAGKLGLTIDFFGAGPDKEALEALLSARADPAVSYRGWIADPNEVLLDYGWLLLPSNAEGLSNAMIEAMSQGVAPVATRVSGCVDHIKPRETGFFLDGADQVSLVAGLESIAAISPADWSAMSDAARMHARSQFDMRNVAAEYRALYRALDSAPTGGPPCIS